MAVQNVDPRPRVNEGALDVDDVGITLDIASNVSNIDIINDSKKDDIFIAVDKSPSEVPNVKGLNSFPLKRNEVWTALNGWNGNFISHVSLRAEPGKVIPVRWIFS